MTRYAHTFLALISAVLLLAGVVFAPAPAAAQSESITVEVIIASTDGVAVDPRTGAPRVTPRGSVRWFHSVHASQQ